MQIGQALDLFISESGLLLQNTWLSVTLAVTTLIAAGWIAGRNHYDIRRAITYTVFTTSIGIGLNIMWFLDAKGDVYSHASMRIASGTMLLLFSMIIAYWIAAIISHFASGLRETLLADVAAWMRNSSDAIYDNLNGEKKIASKNPLKSVALQLKAVNSTNPTKKSTKRGRKKKIVKNTV